MGVPQRGVGGEGRLGGLCCVPFAQTHLPPPTPSPLLFFARMDDAVPVLYPQRLPHAGARDLVCTLSLNVFAYTHGHPQLFCIRQRNIAANGQNPFITGSIVHFLAWLRLSSSSKRVMVTRVMVCIARHRLCMYTQLLCMYTHQERWFLCSNSVLDWRQL